MPEIASPNSNTTRDGTKTDLGNMGWQSDLASSYNLVGDVLRAQGKLAEALKAYRDSVAINERLAAADPSNPAGSATFQSPTTKSASCYPPKAICQRRSKPTATALPSTSGWPRPIPAMPVGSVSLRSGTVMSAACCRRRAICQTRSTLTATP